MSDKKVGVGKYIGQTVKTNIAYRTYRSLVGWTVFVAIIGVASFFTDGVPPSFGGIALGIAAVLGIFAALAKRNSRKSEAKHQDVSNRFYNGE